MASYISTIFSNANLAIGAGLGAVIGAIGGSAIAGGAGPEAIIAGGVAGLGAGIAGAYAGHKFKQSQDRKTPAPLGVRFKSSAVEPGQTAEVEFAPSVALSDMVTAKMTEKLKDKADEVGLSSMKMPYTRFKTAGKASEDGKSFKITSMTMSVPGQEDVTVKLKTPIVLAMKDGVIDENDPENKAKVAQLMEGAMLQTIPKKFHDTMHDIFQESFATAEAASGPKEPEGNIADKAFNALNSPAAKMVMNGVGKTGVTAAASAAVGPGGIPLLKGTNGIGG